MKIFTNDFIINTLLLLVLISVLTAFTAMVYESYFDDSRYGLSNKSVFYIFFAYSCFTFFIRSLKKIRQYL